MNSAASEILTSLGEFWSFRDPNVMWVLLGTALLGLTTGVVGCFAFLQKRALTGDMLAHAALPGVTFAFLLLGERDPLTLLVGAVLSCGVAYITFEALVHRVALKPDSAFAIVLSVSFALGMLLLTYLQKRGDAAQAGLDKLLFGQAASLIRADVELLGIVALLVLFAVALFLRPLQIIVFDRLFAGAAGLAVRRYEAVLSLLLIVTVVIGLQLMGVVLMASLLLTPAASARYWTDRLRIMLLLAGAFGLVAGVLGAQVSYLAPRMPTGPWMVLALSSLFIISFLFAPRRGFVARGLYAYTHRIKVREENILRTLYKLSEEKQDFEGERDVSEVLRYRPMALSQFESVVERLKAQGLVRRGNETLALSSDGVKRGALITRRHRLWERYLTERIDLASDHVHQDAEEMEHLITEDIEQALAVELQGKAKDPHGKKIPETEDES